MKPIKSIFGFSKWVLRFAITLAIYFSFINTFLNFNVNTLSFYIALAYFISITLIIIGGFSSSQTLSVLGGLFLSILCIIQIIITFNGLTAALAYQLLILAGGLIFVSDGK
jgi:hypothetical protein